MSQITSFYPHNIHITPKINIIIKLINNLIILNLLTKIQIGNKEIKIGFDSVESGFSGIAPPGGSRAK